MEFYPTYHLPTFVWSYMSILNYCYMNKWNQTCIHSLYVIFLIILESVLQNQGRYPHTHTHPFFFSFTNDACMRPTASAVFRNLSWINIPLLDLQKAFDKVNCIIVLSKLQCMSFGHETSNISYLTGRITLYQNSGYYIWDYLLCL